MLWDTHMHCEFSGDSKANPEDMIKKAIDLGLEGICFTDHLDYDYLEEPGLFDLDIDAYYMKISELSEKYAGIIPVRTGMEVGLQPHIVEKNNKAVASHSFDFIIGSSHVAHGIDPYYDKFYQGKTEDEAYREYFESVLENINTAADYDVYGHIDYVVRYGPNKNKFYSYKKYSDIIDAILKQLIENGKGIEINTGGFKYGLGHPNPTEEIIKRYRELGGEIITLGADAHMPEHIAYDFNKIPDILKNAGFNHYTVFSKRKPIMIDLK